MIERTHFVNVKDAREYIAAFGNNFLGGKQIKDITLDGSRKVYIDNMTDADALEVANSLNRDIEIPYKMGTLKLTPNGEVNG